MTYLEMLGPVGVKIAKVCFLWILRTLRPDVRIVLEQPAVSWMFKVDIFQEFLRSQRMSKTLTWMGYWGAPILKPTHLWSNMAFHGGR